MTNILKGTGSSLTHALSDASASSLGNVRIGKQSLAVDNNGSVEVAVSLVSDPRVFIGQLYSGEEATIAKAVTDAGLPTNPRIMHQNIGRQSNGSVHLLFTVSPDGIPCTLYSGTGSEITEATTAAGLPTNPRIAHMDAAKDATGSVTVVYAVTSDERVP